MKPPELLLTTTNDNEQRKEIKQRRDEVLKYRQMEFFFPHDEDWTPRHP